MNDIELLRKYFLAIRLSNQIDNTRILLMRQIKQICKELNVQSIWDY